MNQVRRDYFALYRHYAALPHRQTGAYLMVGHGLSRLDITPPPPVAPGDYRLRYRVGAVKDSLVDRRFVEVGYAINDGFNWDLSSVLSSHQVTGSIEEPQIIEVPIKVSSDTSVWFGIREKQPRDVSHRASFHYGRFHSNGYGAEPVNWVDWVEWEGPLNTTQLEPVLFANTSNASEPDHARAVIDRFAKRAFRGKQPNAEFIEKLVGLYQARRSAGEAFDIAIREPLSVILASPGFLYLQEIGAATAAPAEKSEVEKNLSGPEFASRLSYFLWSSPPDPQLLATDFSKPENILKEVDRMLADKKSREFVNGFVHQWLTMSRLDFFQFNNSKFRVSSLHPPGSCRKIRDDAGSG
jgi:hypothetical protein